MKLTELVLDPLDGFEDVEQPKSPGLEAGERAVEEVQREMASRAEATEAG